MLKYETNSKKIQKGQTFVAVVGHTVDGHDFIAEAIEKGAEKIVVSKSVSSTVPVVFVEDTEKYLKEKLVEEYSEQLKDLHLIGVTGTNGKTTTCYLVYQLLNKMGIKAAYIGTIGYYRENFSMELSNTTPDILTMYNLLFDAKENGCDTVVLEVSSHALSLHRLDGLRFQIGAFTNLTEDHLDFYKTMEKYLEAKLEFLDYIKENGVFLVNADDETSLSFLNKGKKVFLYGLDEKSDLVISKFTIYPNSTELVLKDKDKTYQVKTNLTSKFNVYNYALAFFILKSLGLNSKQIVEKTIEIYPPKGRCETYLVKKGFAVVDYAHTPDAVEKVISAYKELATSRIITVIGCGGDRDRLKRPIMGRIASENSDYVIFTNDNPRTEDEEKIMEDILKGVEKKNYEVILDRHKAIKKALDFIEDNDIVLLLGKGHENYQIIGRDKIYFDDSEEIKKYCKSI